MAGLRAIPNFKVFRPADINETLESWELALKNNGPSAIVLSRQKLPFISKVFEEKNKTSMGAYQLKITSHDNKLTILASGSEVSLALEVQEQLKNANIDSKVVSVPCKELFDIQSEEYKNKILEPDSLIVSIEAGTDVTWNKFLKKDDLAFCISSFGKSGPYKKLFENYNLTSEKIVSKIQKKLRK